MGEPRERAPKQSPRAPTKEAPNLFLLGGGFLADLAGGVIILKILFRIQRGGRRGGWGVEGGFGGGVGVGGGRGWRGHTGMDCTWERERKWGSIHLPPPPPPNRTVPPQLHPTPRPPKAHPTHPPLTPTRSPTPLTILGGQSHLARVRKGSRSRCVFSSKSVATTCLKMRPHPPPL